MWLIQSFVFFSHKRIILAAVCLLERILITVAGMASLYDSYSKIPLSHSITSKNFNVKLMKLHAIIYNVSNNLFFPSACFMIDSGFSLCELGESAVKYPPAPSPSK